MTDQQVSVEMFTGEVAMCKEVEVMVMRTTEE